MKYEVMKRPKFFRIHFVCRVRASSIRTKAPQACRVRASSIRTKAPRAVPQTHVTHASLQYLLFFLSLIWTKQSAH